MPENYHDAIEQALEHLRETRDYDAFADLCQEFLDSQFCPLNTRR